MDITNDYNLELCKCIVSSIDMQSPYYSRELNRLRDEMAKLGIVDEAKLEEDSRLIQAAAAAENWKDRFAEMHPPPTREEALEGIKRCQITIENFDELNGLLRKIVKE